QMDRFLLKLLVRYPAPAAEREILSRSLESSGGVSTPHVAAPSVVARSPDHATGHLPVAFEDRDAGPQTTPFSARERDGGKEEPTSPGPLPTSNFKLQTSNCDPEPTLSPAEIDMARAALVQVRVSDLLQQYILELISATRDPYRF